MDSYFELLNKFENVSRELNRLIQKFPVDRREEIVFDKWSLKNVVSHLNHWMAHNINCLECLTRGITPQWQTDTDEYNREGVEKRKDWTWKDVYSEFLTLKDKQISSYKSLPKELYEKRFWSERRHTPLSFLSNDISHWQVEHLTSLRDLFLK